MYHTGSFGGPAGSNAHAAVCVRAERAGLFMHTLRSSEALGCCELFTELCL